MPLSLGTFLNTTTGNDSGRNALAGVAVVAVASVAAVTDVTFIVIKTVAASAVVAAITSITAVAVTVTTIVAPGIVASSAKACQSSFSCTLRYER